MKKKYPRSFSRRSTNRVIAIVLVTMLLLSGWVFYHSVTRFGQQIGSHFIDVMGITNEEMDLWLSAVEISAANIEDEISYDLNRPSNVCTALGDELRLNPYVNGASVGFIPNYFSDAGRWFEPYASRDSVAGEINIRQIGSGQHDYFNMEWYKKGRVSAAAVVAGVGMWEGAWQLSIYPSPVSFCPLTTTFFIYIMISC